VSAVRGGEEGHLLPSLLNLALAPTCAPSSREHRLSLRKAIE